MANSTVGLVLEVLSVACFTSSIFLLFFPGIFKRVNEISKIWISTRKFTKELDVMRDVDAPLIKGCRLLGLFALALSAFLMYLLLRR